jgi:hypothetical protein
LAAPDCPLARISRDCGAIMKRVAAFVLCAAFLSNPLVPCASMAALAQAPTQNSTDGAVQQEPKGDDAKDHGDITSTVLLRSGTEVKLVFAQSLSSKHATVGEKVELRVAEDVRVDDIVVVPARARVLGTVVQGKKNEKYGNSKDLAVSVDYIVVKGKRIKLTGERQQKAKTNIGSAAAATIGLGLSGLMIYMSQREAWIREGTPATAYISGDVLFTPSEI